MNAPELKPTQSLHWTFHVVHDHTTGEFIIYANGKKSYTTDAVEDCPSAMKEYFENWDTDLVTI